MKNKVTLIFIFNLMTCLSFAQDVIYRNDKSEVRSKIIEVLENDIKYKKYEFLDGPTYSMSKSDIYMIVYKNGQKEMFETKVSAKVENQPSKIENSIRKTENVTSNQNTVSQKTVSKEFFVRKKSVNIIDLGVTIKSFSDYQIPNIIFTTDMLLWDNIGIGGHVGFNSISNEENIFGNTIKVKSFSSSFGARGNYYLNHLLKINPNKIHVYAGVSLIYTMVDSSITSDSAPSTSSSASDTNIWGQVGGRYFFSKRFGINTEIVFQDETNFKIGLSYRISGLKDQ